MGDIEFGKCDICGKEGQLKRKYYYYDIDCTCCMTAEKMHFEIVRFCPDCTPRPPYMIQAMMTPAVES